MRCTNDIKARIKNEVKPIVEEIINKYNKAIESEKDKIYLWKKNKLNSLKDQIAPLVNTWAKDLKKNSSSYTWEGCPSSTELAEKVLHKMFSEGYYRDSFPDVSTKKLKELQAQKDLFRIKVESILADTYIKVTFIKSLDDLNDLIEQTKIYIRSLYAD